VRPAPRPVTPPTCLECGKAAELVQSQRIYPRRPDLWNRPMWLCACGAYTSCHDGTQRPKGRPAAKTTRNARMDAHAAFDRLWQAKQVRDGCSKKKARGAGYKWLGEQLGLDPKDCHIGEMDAATARRVTQLCRRFRV
jgi:hypothetical protein